MDCLWSVTYLPVDGHAECFQLCVRSGRWQCGQSHPKSLCLSVSLGFSWSQARWVRGLSTLNSTRYHGRTPAPPDPHQHPGLSDLLITANLKGMNMSRFFGFFFPPGFMAYRIQFPNQGSNLWPWQWKLRVLTTGQLGNSPTGLVFMAKRQGIFRTTFKGLFTPSFWLQNWTNEEKSIKQGMFWGILVFPKLINKNVALCLCMCGWIPLLSTWNYHNSVNRL